MVKVFGIGILCEIFLHRRKSKNFELVKNLLNLYNLPTNLLDLDINKNKSEIKKKIFKNIFLDKKKLVNTQE